MAIELRAGPAGTRAVLAGLGLDVWEVVETLRSSGNSVPRTARYLDVPEEAVREAVAWRDAHPAEVDGWIAAAHERGDEAYRRWHAEQWGPA